MQMEIKRGVRESKNYIERAGDQRNLDVARATYVAEEVAIRNKNHYEK